MLLEGDRLAGDTQPVDGSTLSLTSLLHLLPENFLPLLAKQGTLGQGSTHILTQVKWNQSRCLSVMNA